MIKEMRIAAKADFGISLSGCGYDRISGKTDIVNGTADGYCIVFITEDSGVFSCQDKNYHMEKGDYIVLGESCRKGCIYPAETDSAAFCYMEFCGKDAGFYLRETGAAELCVGRGSLSGFRSAVMNCIDYFESEFENAAQLKFSSFLFDALISLNPPRKKRSRVRTSGQAERALRFIEYNYMNGISARDIALLLNIDRTHFFRIFKAKTGVSPEQYIMNLRVSKACEILRNEGCSVGETAALVGVNDVYYFSKLFKKMTGQSPTEYRKTHTEPTAG